MDNFEQIDIQKAQDMIRSHDVIVVDIRDEDSYKSGHINGALLLNDENIERFISDSDKTKPVICYCYHGISSQSAAGFLKKQGFCKVYSLIGGFEEWRKNS